MKNFTYQDKYTKIEDIASYIQPFFHALYGVHMHGGAIILSNQSFKSRKTCYTIQQAAETAAKQIQSSGAAYFTLNAYRKRSKRYGMPSDENLWGLSAIGIDIDIKDKNKGCAARNEFVAFLVLNGIPRPNVVVESGSGGYHLYWTFEHLPYAMKNSVQAVKLVLIEKLLKLEGEWDFHNLEVDTRTKDASRNFRVPYSNHEDTGRKAEYVIFRKPYRFKELRKKVIDFAYRFDYLETNTEKMIQRYRNRGIELPKSYRRFNSPDALAENRIAELKRLANDGYQFHHCREAACFILRNNALVLDWSEDKVMRELRILNQHFYSPLKESELRSNSKARKHYKMTNETIRNMLCLDGDMPYFIKYKKKTKGKKEACRRIIEQIKSLVEQCFSISKIAHILGVSISLVKRRRAELARVYQNIKELGVQMQKGFSPA